jgi:uncharacterized protein YbjT (DUF2867 family)
MTNNGHDLTVVIGATGKTGRRVVERLRRQGVPVRGASRSSAPPFDWGDRSTWAPALDGASAAYVTFFPDIAVPGACEEISALSELAVERGTRRLVLLSGRGEVEAQRAEQALQASGAEWTIVRCSWFMQNFSESFLLDPILAGEVALPDGSAAEPFVDVEDIADVATAALTDARHAGEVYELTGPRLLTFGEAVQQIARATGRPIAYTSISHEAYAASLRDEGVPDDVASLVGYLFAEVLDGRNAHLTDGVQRALGRPPRDFADYARAAAGAGAWSAR